MRASSANAARHGRSAPRSTASGWSAEQIAHLLCELLLRFQWVGLSENNTYVLPATQVELGDAFGLSTVHVNRMLQRLRKEGLVVTVGRYVSIPDPERLMKVAGFDPTYLQVGGGAAQGR